MGTRPGVSVGHGPSRGALLSLDAQLVGTTAIVQRDTHTSLPSSSLMRISQTWVRRPTATGLTRPVTHPEDTGRTLLALISIPKHRASSPSTVSVAA